MDQKILAGFTVGAMSNQTQGRTKMEQRFFPGTRGNSLYSKVRRLTPAERQGLVPIKGDWRKAPIKPQQ